jgi:lipoate-protein ligase A
MNLVAIGGRGRALFGGGHRLISSLSSTAIKGTWSKYHVTEQAAIVSQERGFSSTGGIGVNEKSPMSWLDLTKSGLSILERLMIEEALLRHDPLQRQWLIVGVHDPTHNLLLKFTNVPESSKKYIKPPHAIQNPNCAVVLGLGGKPDESLLNMQAISDIPPMLIKRFTGGGTVVVDHSSLFTTIIGRTALLPDVQPFPREIMQWSGDAIFGPTFDELSTQSLKNQVNRRSLVVKSRSCGIADSTRGELVDFPNTKHGKNKIPGSDDHRDKPPTFALIENDYILESADKTWSRKMGGNAQSIVKGGWLHHTSFLWDFVEDHMEYLRLPSKRPAYRADRSHLDFVTKLKDHYPHAAPTAIFGAMKTSLQQPDSTNKGDIQLVDSNLREVLQLIDDELGGMQKWYETCRSRVLKI